MNSTEEHISQNPDHKPVIEIKNLYKSFGSLKVLNGFNLKLMEGENLVLMGKSGSGKSVMIKCLIGLMEPDSGSIEVLGNDILKLKQQELDELRTEIGFLFQGSALYDSMTVRENLEFPMRRHTNKVDLKNTDELVMEALESVGLASAIDLMPAELSGGMQQRASIARALAFDADILLMDEPFGALDEIVRDHLNEQLLKLWARTEKTIGFVTHSIPEAVYLSTKIVVMSPRPGRITDVIDSPLPQERPLEIRDTPEFIEIAHRVRDGLRAGHSDDGSL